jgi:TolB protein
MTSRTRFALLLLAAPLVLLFVAPPAGSRPQTGTAAPPATGGSSLPSDVRLEISKSGISKIAIAVPPLLPVGTAGFPTETIATLNETLVSDLESSGVFARVDPVLYPSGSTDSLPPDLAIRWRDIGSEVLVGGKIELVDGNVILDSRVWDTKSAKMIMGRRYRGAPSWARRIAHTLANDLLYYFTGRNGTFLTKIAFVSDRGGSKEIWMMDADGEGQTRLTRHGNLALHPAWSPDGSAIVHQAYLPAGPRLVKIPAGGGAMVTLSTGVELNASPSFSPDGQKIAFVGAKKGNSSIFVIGADGNGLRQLTQFRSIEAAPCWSPTGREIAFVSNRSGSPQIYVMDAEGANVRRLTFEGSYNDSPAWSPDGSRIAFTTRVGGDFHVAVINLATGIQTILTDQGRNESPTWSPDGVRIAFSSTRRGTEQIFVMEADGRNQRALTTEGTNFSPSWSQVGL